MKKACPVLKDNQELIEVNGYNVVLTYLKDKRELIEEEIEEMVTQTFDGVFGGTLSTDVKWSARIY